MSVLEETPSPAGMPHPDDEKMHILVVDDDSRIRELLQTFLIRRGFRVTVAEDAATARRALRGLTFDLLILDWMMPGEDGVSLTRSLRETMNVPILMLTAKAETDSRIGGLEAGVDDYLPKPFDPRELLLRIESILRRAAPPSKDEPAIVAFGPFTWATGTRELKRGGEPVRLTDREQDMMSIFVARLGETVPRHELVADGVEVGERTIDVQINRLRRKLEADSANPLWLQTVRGIGYRLNPVIG
ncbi:DNA-binding response regulator [Notoacmeibacter marinus]|uniref:DNA-binding response regulator n=1 Tax=Notoacmeibacter marinus TaxID=1876515 RepID=A0A231UXC4_9HYPH|nr:response regulator [Notoacmeibacter marinus]OXT00540.1 DNA-binding response regulator [Notoacmeibacter marinus]